MNKEAIFGFLLLAVFFISLLPYNAFHHHQDELHRIAVVAKDESHHCKLDDYSCQDDLLENHECEHQSHLAESTPDCFFCQFHFNKVFEITVPVSAFFVGKGNSIVQKTELHLFKNSIFILFNKGPPSLSY